MPSEAMSKPRLCLSGAAGEAHAHAVGARADGVFAVEEGRDLAVREVIVLGALDHADARPRPSGETFEADFAALVRLRLAQRQPVAGGERAALPAADAAADIGRRRCRAPARCRSRPRPPHRARSPPVSAPMRSASPRRSRRLCMRRDALSGARRRVGKDLDRGVRARHRDAHARRLRRPASGPCRRLRARRRRGALPTSRLAACRLTGSSAPLTGTPRC